MAIDVIVGGGTVTVIVADPNTLVYPACVEVAMQLPVPAPEGVNKPVAVIVPPVAVQVTPVPNDPVPCTFVLHAVVCAVVIVEGVALTVIDVIVGGGTVTVIVLDPDTFVYPACVEFAMQVPVPAPEGVNTPAAVIVPPVAVQVTPVPNAPVPCTFALHSVVCAVVIDKGVAVTVIDVIVGGTELTATVPEAAAVPPLPVAVTV